MSCQVAEDNCCKAGVSWCSLSDCFQTALQWFQATVPACFETASRLLSGLLSPCSPNSVQQWLQTSMKRKKKKSLTCPFNLARRISVVLRYGSGLSHSLYNSREVGQRAADSIAASFSSPFLRDSALPKLAWGRIATTSLPGGGHFSCACSAGTQPPDKLDSQVCPTHLVCNVLLCCGFS